MPYLAPHFDPDVFVSYSHGDPQGGRAPLRDWTHELIRRLQDQIHSLEPRFKLLHIWTDSENDPTGKLTEELRKRVAEAGVLMIVMSNHYLESSWCGDERNWFKNQIESRPGDSGRVFIIRAQKTDTALWPDFLRDERGHVIPGFSFYDPENGVPWDYPDLREPGADFRKELLRLQTWLTKRLREMRERADKKAQESASAAAPPQPSGQPGQRRVYVHAPPDTEAVRDEVDAALTSDGITPVAPVIDVGKSLADWQREATALRVETAKRCEALTLLRVADARRFIGDLLDIGVDERRRIADARGAPLPCAVFDKTGDSLPIDVARFGVERFDLTLTDWRSRFRSWLDESRPAPAGAAV